MRATVMWFTEQAIYMSNWYGIGAEREKKIRAEVAKDLKAELEAKLTPVLREQIEQELWDKACAKARTEIVAEHEAERPTIRERKALQEFVKEVELDCHAQATVASVEADKAKQRLYWSKRIRNSFAYLLGFGFLPLLFLAYQHFGRSLGMAVTGVTMAIMLLTLTLTNSSKHTRLAKAIEKNRRTSSNYLLVAEDAKLLRLVKAERLDTKKQLDALVDNLASRKNRLDNEHHPRTDDLHQARDSVRVRIDTGIPFQDIDDFEERLAEAEARTELDKGTSTRNV